MSTQINDLPFYYPLEHIEWIDNPNWIEACTIKELITPEQLCLIIDYCTDLHINPILLSKCIYNIPYNIFTKHIAEDFIMFLDEKLSIVKENKYE
jgi:hypothetical protein